MDERAYFTIDGYQIAATLPPSLTRGEVELAAPPELLPTTEHGFESWLEGLLLQITGQRYIVRIVPTSERYTEGRNCEEGLQAIIGHDVEILDA
jgi:hypothetical protein